MKSATTASQQTATTHEVFVPEANQWVQLRDCLSEYSGDQALLLCESESDEWIAWVPNHGQTVLGREQMLMAI